MRAAVATLLVLVLALAATGGEARAGDGRHLLGDYKPEESCKYSNCKDLLKEGCDWLPTSDIVCDNNGTYSVKVKNCFRKKCGYVSISAGGKCYKYKTFGDYITKLDLKCGDKITIFAWDKYLIKGDGSKPCIDDSSRSAGHDHCKTCHYQAQYNCPYAKKPGDQCRAAGGDCDLPSMFDKACVCPANGFRAATVTCRNSTGLCDNPSKCTGNSATCPVNTYKSPTTLCRASTGPCDAAEYCTGTSSYCPDDRYAPHDTICRNATGPCDAPAYCKHGYCPKNEFLRGKLCRKARGDCERDAYCNGYRASCPDCELRRKGTECRKAYGECDVPEVCDGKNYMCPDDGFAPNTTECRKSAGPCDAAEYCTGKSKKCPDDYCGPVKKLVGPYCPYKPY